MISEEEPRVLSAFSPSPPPPSPPGGKTTGGGEGRGGEREKRGACWRQIGVPPFTSAKFISSKNEHFRGYVIQADDGSNRIFVRSHPSIPDEDHGRVIGSPHPRRDLTFHIEPLVASFSPHDIYTSHDIFSREGARSRKRKLFRMYVKKKNPSSRLSGKRSLFRTDSFISERNSLVSND